MSWLLPPLPPKWEAALRDVRAQTPAARVASAERLALAEPAQLPAALEGLALLARDTDPRVRTSALRALGELAQPEALEPLTEALDDADPLVREHAVIALSLLPFELATPALLEAARSPHPELRFHAVSALADVAPEQAVREAIRLLNDSDDRVRASAAHAAATLSDSDALRTPALLRALEAALNDDDARVRAEAAIGLARRGDPRASKPLLAALLDEELVLAALDAAPSLPRIDPELHAAIVALSLSVLRPRLFKAAAGRALVRMKDPRGRAALREAMQAFRSDGRTFAASAAGELGLDELAPDLARLAKRPRGTDLVALAKALGQLAPWSPEARAALTDLALRDDEVGAQSHAELTRLAAKSPDSPANP